MVDAYKDYKRNGLGIKDAMNEAKRDWLDDGDSVKSKLEKEYVFLEAKKENEKYFVSCAELEDYLKRKGVKLSPKRSGQEIKDITGEKSVSIWIDTETGGRKKAKVRLYIRRRSEWEAEQKREQEQQNKQDEYETTQIQLNKTDNNRFMIVDEEDRGGYVMNGECSDSDDE
jgi:hypothetical protein